MADGAPFKLSRELQEAMADVLRARGYVVFPPGAPAGEHEAEAWQEVAQHCRGAAAAYGDTRGSYADFARQLAGEFRASARALRAAAGQVGAVDDAATRKRGPS